MVQNMDEFRIKKTFRHFLHFSPIFGVFYRFSGKFQIFTVRGKFETKNYPFALKFFKAVFR